MSASSTTVGRINNPPAVVLGLGVNGYGIVRALHREGVHTVGVYSDRQEYGRHSRYCTAFHFDPSLADAERCERLIALSAQWTEKPVLFASSDAHATFFAEHAGLLTNHFLFHWVAPEILANIVNKDSIAQLSQQAGVLAPRTHITQSREDIARSAADFVFPCLIKPMRSFETQFPRDMKNFFAGTAESLCEFYRVHPGTIGATIWQEIVEGRDDDVYQCNLFVTANGDVHSVCCVRKLHQYPQSFGHMSFGRSERTADIVPDSVRLLNKLGYRGLASLEFKREPRTGNYYFIEMNPRLPLYNSLFAACGVNFPYLAYLDLTDTRNLPPRAAKPKDGVHWFSLSDQLHRFSEAGERRRFLKWLWSARKARGFAWLEPRDLGPFARYFKQVLRDIAAAIFRRFRPERRSPRSSSEADP